AVADYVMAGVMEAFHRGEERRKQQRGRLWKRVEFREIADTRWLVFGMGHIGRAVARRAKGFDAHVTGVRRNPAGNEPADATIAPAGLARALPEADVVVLTAPLTDETRGVVDADFLDAMKAGSVLVNVARGGLVDERALLAALDRGRPAHAVLDVFEEEPLPAWNRFWSHPRVLMSAHCAGASPGTIRRNDELFLDNLDRFLSGRLLRLRIDPALLAGRAG
ncbi:MAG: D-2-hydroxyacid dehydrogenase, partial [Alphaproteobacteria bacterium]|nr:D-2-hydroxyacid dehydrogenase [Alphaproteobacteria bacterium]